MYQIHRQGCCKVHSPRSCSQASQSLVELVIKSPLSARQMRFSSMDKAPNGSIIEQSQQMRSMPHTQLRTILIEGAVAPIMEPIFNGIITNDKFCLSRMK